MTDISGQSISLQGYESANSHTDGVCGILGYHTNVCNKLSYTIIYTALAKSTLNGNDIMVNNQTHKSSMDSVMLTF